jgi:hypothetical protein
LSDGALVSLHGREPQFMKLEIVVRQDAGVERRCAGEVWLRRGVIAESGCVERGGGGVAARRVKGEEVGVDDVTMDVTMEDDVTMVKKGVLSLRKCFR